MKQGKELTEKQGDALNERQGVHPNKRADVGLIDEIDEGKAVMVDVCIAATCSKTCQKFNSDKEYDPSSAAALLELHKENEYDKLFDTHHTDNTGELYYFGVGSNGVPGPTAMELLTEMSTWNGTDFAAEKWRMEQQLSITCQTGRATQIMTTLMDMSLDVEPTYPYMSGPMPKPPPPTFIPVSMNDYSSDIITQEKIQLTHDVDAFMTSLDMAKPPVFDDHETSAWKSSDDDGDPFITQSDDDGDPFITQCDDDGDPFITQSDSAGESDGGWWTSPQQIQKMEDEYTYYHAISELYWIDKRIPDGLTTPDQVHLERPTCLMYPPKQPKIRVRQITMPVHTRIRINDDISDPHYDKDLVTTLPLFPAAKCIRLNPDNPLFLPDIYMWTNPNNETDESECDDLSIVSLVSQEDLYADSFDPVDVNVFLKKEV
jgi:hypothetical protein